MSTARRAALPRGPFAALHLGVGGRLRRLGQSPLAVAVLYVAGGALLGWAMLRLDVAVGAQDIPEWLHFGEQSARALVSGFATSFLFVVAIVFLVRITSLQLSGQAFSSRLLRQFLTDRMQRNAMGSIVGALAYAIVVVRAIPSRQGGAEVVPHLSVNVACALAVVAALAIVFAVHNASGWGQMGRLIRRLTDDCVTLVKVMHPERGHPQGDPSREHRPPPAPATPPRLVMAYDSGWVQRIDEDALLHSVPPGSTLTLAARVGVFVVEGTPLYALWAPGDDAADPGDVPGGVKGLRKAVVIGTDPLLEENLAYGLSQLVDIAGQSMASSGQDATTAQEVVLYLGVVLRELLLRDLPAPYRIGDGGRRLLRPHETSFDDYISAAFDRIRILGAGSPGLTACLLSTIGMLVRELENAGLAERTEGLHHQARLVVDSAENDTSLGHDVERIRQQALDHDLLTST